MKKLLLSFLLSLSLLIFVGTTTSAKSNPSQISKYWYHFRTVKVTKPVTVDRIKITGTPEYNHIKIDKKITLHKGQIVKLTSAGSNFTWVLKLNHKTAKQLWVMFKPENTRWLKIIK